MGVRSIRFYDLLAVRRIEADQGAHLLWPSAVEAAPSALSLALASAWQDVNQTVFSFVQRERGMLIGLAQAAARPTHDAWDLVRLAIHPLAPAGSDREDIADNLLEALLYATGGRGGLRTFARAETESDGLNLLARRGFRHYADEYTLFGDHLDVTPVALPEHLQLRVRLPADAWGIFQLYCSVAPAGVRHAEGLSSKRWGRGSPVSSAFARLARPREIVLTDDGMIVGWVRLTNAKGPHPQRLEIMLHPRAYDALPALLAHAVVTLDIPRDHQTVCRVRAYDDAVRDGLQRVGFAIAAEHALFVKHAVARVTERQLLLAALRAQSLSLDVSRYQQPTFPSTPTRAGTTTPEYPYD